MQRTETRPGIESKWMTKLNEAGFPQRRLGATHVIRSSPYQGHEDQSSGWEEDVQGEVHRPPAEQDPDAADGVVHSRVVHDLVPVRFLETDEVLRPTLTS